MPSALPEFALKPADWKGDLVRYEDLDDYKGSGPVVVHTKDKEQAEAGWAILQQVAPTASFTSSGLIHGAFEKCISIARARWQG